jgi:putative membrane protein
MKPNAKSIVIRHVATGATAATVLLTAILTAQAQDQDPSPPKQGQAIKQSVTTSSFLKESIQCNQAEIAFAEAATQKSQNEEVKKFAEEIRKDHTDANQKLKPLAQKEGVAVNQPLDEKHQKKLTELQQASGADFDQQFAKGMLKGHAKEVGRYQRASTQLQDPELKQFVQETLPTLRQHLQHAQEMAKAVGIDQATISSLSREMPEGVGGTSDTDETERGTSKPDEPKKSNQP